MSEYYNISDIKKGIRNPRLIKDEAKRQLFSNYKRMVSSYYKLQIDCEPLDVMEQDWDNLIILDACRFDYFRKRNNIAGELNKVVSYGGESWEFMENNFSGKKLHDTIYITSNPWIYLIEDRTFFSVKNTLNRWDSDIEVVHPSDVASAAIEAHQNYPHKRLIIHFMQPHTPWLGSTAETIRKKYNPKGNHPNFGKKKMSDHDISDPRTGSIGWFDLVRSGAVSHQTMERAYSETLDIVLDYAENLLQEISGKSVVTADHGEMLGERIFLHRLWGHYEDLWTKELRYVPWLEIDSEERREIITDEPLERERIDEEVVEKRLKALGYQ